MKTGSTAGPGHATSGRQVFRIRRTRNVHLQPVPRTQLVDAEQDYERGSARMALAFRSPVSELATSLPTAIYARLQTNPVMESMTKANQAMLKGVDLSVLTKPADQIT